MKFLLPIFSVFLFSCTQWTLEDSTLFMDLCDKTKWGKEYCDCALDKVKSKFSNFDDLAENEQIMAEYLIECLEYERKIKNEDDKSN